MSPGQANNHSVVDSILIPHTRFAKAVSAVEQAFTYAEFTCDPICLAIVGESRTGKSRVMEECFSKHPPERTPDGLEMPILRVKTPSKPTAKGLAEQMLVSMRDPQFHTGTENAKTARLMRLMREAGTQMVMVDEFQQFCDEASHKIMHHVADWLKMLVDDAGVSLVVGGLERSLAVLEQNEQLAGRFDAPIILPRFDWTIPDQRAEFIGILGAFHEALSGGGFELPDLANSEMAFRCYCATGGLIGYVTKFLKKAVLNANDADTKTIGLADLMHAHHQAVWMKDEVGAMPNPFSKEFSTEPNETLLEAVRGIGVQKLPVRTKAGRTSQGGGKRNARSVLSGR